MSQLFTLRAPGAEERRIGQYSVSRKCLYLATGLYYTCSMQKIIPHLWFDRQAKEAAEFYVSAFGGDSKITSLDSLSDTPSGNVEVVSFRVLGFDFVSFSAGPMFKLNPSASFFVNFDPSRNGATAALDSLWAKLADGGTPLMPLDKYPFSDRYGWIQDKYGLSWQLILRTPGGDARPNIIPSLLFTGEVCGKAEEAMKFYASVFAGSKVGTVARYSAEHAPDKPGTIMYEDFALAGHWFAAMDSAYEHGFTFNEAISFMVSCDTQEEIDYFWGKLAADPDAGQCGWLKDRFGVSWQVTPAILNELMRGTPAQRARVTEAFLEMKKFDIAALKRACDGTA